MSKLIFMEPNFLFTVILWFYWFLLFCPFGRFQTTFEFFSLVIMHSSNGLSIFWAYPQLIVGFRRMTYVIDPFCFFSLRGMRSFQSVLWLWCFFFKFTFLSFQCSIWVPFRSFWIDEFAFRTQNWLLLCLRFEAWAHE